MNLHAILDYLYVYRKTSVGVCFISNNNMQVKVSLATWAMRQPPGLFLLFILSMTTFTEFPSSTVGLLSKQKASLTLVHTLLDPPFLTLPLRLSTVAVLRVRECEVT